MGIGLAAFIDKAGTGPSGNLAKRGGLHGGWESAVVRVHSDGKVTIFAGSHSHGQGHEITFCQIAADRLGLPIEDIRARRRRHRSHPVRQRHLGRALGLGRRNRDLPRRRQGDRQGRDALPRTSWNARRATSNTAWRIRGARHRPLGRFCRSRRCRLSRRRAAAGRLLAPGPRSHRVLRSARYQRSAGDASRRGHCRSRNRRGDVARHVRGRRLRHR